MSWVGRALSSVTQYYKEINPSTLSGAIDVVVVERKIPSISADGTYETYEDEVELACTPFHVRFGKLSVLRPSDRRVVVRVNGKEVPLAMKVGETGEAFFVFETEDTDIPEDMQTSPLAKPLRDQQEHGGDDEPEPLDLGDAATGGDGETGAESIGRSSDREIQKETKPSNTAGKDLGDPSEGGSALAQGAASRLTQMGSMVAAEAAHVAGDTLHLHRSRQEKRSKEEEGPSAEEQQDNKGDGATISSHHKQKQNSKTQASREVQDLERRLSDSLHLDPLDSLDKEPGDDAREAAKHADSLTSHGCQLEGQPVASTNAQTQQVPTGTLSTSLSNSRHDLMLDMAGYKVGNEEQSKAKSIENHLLAGELVGEKLGEDVLLFTQSLLRSADLEKSRHGAEVLEQYHHKPKAASVSALTGSEEPPSLSSSPRQDHTPRASSPTPSISDNTVTPLTSSNTTFSVSADGSSHTFELALCRQREGPVDTVSAAQATINELEFNLNRITIEELRENASLVNDPSLVCRFGGRYLTWENASPVLASLGIYQDAIASAPLQSSSQDDVSTPAGSDNAAASSSTQGRTAVAPAASRRWSWWGSGAKAKPSPAPAGGSSASVSSPDSRNARTSRPRAASATSAGRASRAASPEPFQGSVNDRSVRASSPEPEPLSECDEDEGQDQEEQEPGDLDKHYAKTLRLTSEQLKKLNLKKGRNDVSFSVMSSYSSNVVKCTSRIFLWDQDYKCVISDIDGTITKSDALGHVFAMIGRDWTHNGVAKLYTDIARNGYKMVYLTSRAIGQADTTREYLRGISQNGCVLPEGPVIMSPDRLMTSLHREVIARKPEVFKMACLQDIQNVFKTKPFYAGFGNRITDALSYRTVDIPSARIFTIDSYGDVRMELLELAGHRSSYIAMTDLVDQMFPPVNRGAQPEFSDFNYWRAPLPKVDLPDFAPPSPKSPTPSDTSSRYSLRRITSSITRRPPEVNAAVQSGRIASGSKPTSPLSVASVEEEEPDQLQLEGPAMEPVPPKRSRSNSMPGSFEDDSPLQDQFHSQGDESSARRRAILSDKMRQEQQQHDDDTASVVSGEDEDGFPMDDMDFSSVPY